MSRGDPNGRRRAQLLCVVALAFARGHRTDAAGTCLQGDGDLVACLKAKAIAALDRASRVPAIPIVGSAVTLVRDRGHREQRTGDPAPAAVAERDLLSEPDAALDAMLRDKAVELLRGRSLRVALSELVTGGEEGRGKMKKTMGMMMTVAAMKAMMVIPLALGLLFLMAGKAMIISKIALVLSLIITLKKLLTKSGEHVVHETHTASAAWPSAGGPIGGGWDKRSSSAAAGQLLAYGNPYKP